MTESAAGDSLGRRAGRSGVVLALRTLLQMGVALARVALVARALGPEQMGIYGVLSLTVEAARVLTSLGPNAVLIQRSEVSSKYVDTYWVLSVAQGAVMGFLVLLASPLLSRAHSGTDLFSLQLLVGGAVFVSGWYSPGAVLAERESKFSRVALVETVAVIIDALVVVALAFWLRSALALAVGALARACVEVALSFRFFPVRVRLRWDSQAGRELLSAAGPFLLMAVGSYVTIYGDNVTITTVLGVHALGLYVVAYRLAEMPFSPLFAVTKRVMFPVLSRLRNDQALLRSVVLDTIYTQMLVLCPVAVGMSLFAEVFISLFYGGAYVGAIDVLRALVFVSLGRGLANMLVPVLMSSARYAYLSRLKWVEVASFVPAVIAGTLTWGLVGAALGAGLSYTFAGLLRVVAVHREHALAPADLLKALGAPLVTTLLAAAVAVVVRRATGSAWLYIGAFAAMYVGLILVTQRAKVVAAIAFFRGAPRPG